MPEKGYYAYAADNIWTSLLVLFDDHSPIHVHVENGDGRAKILLDPVVELFKNEGMKAKDIKKALTLCEAFREDFIEKWHEHIDQKD